MKKPSSICILNLTFWVLEMGEYSGAEVALLVLVREVVVRNPHGWVVLDGADVLLVSRVLSLAGHPHRAADGGVPGLRHSLDVVDQSRGGVLGQVSVVGIGIGEPAEDLGGKNES